MNVMTDMVDILEVMYDTAMQVCNNVYIQNRPASTSTKNDKFIVVELPSAITDNEISQDGSYNDFSTTGQFTIFVKDRSSSKNSNATPIVKANELANSLKGLFPVKDVERSVKLRRPRIMIPSVSDDRGFHYTVIQCDITTNV